MCFLLLRLSALLELLYYFRRMLLMHLLPLFQQMPGSLFSLHFFS